MKTCYFWNEWQVQLCIVEDTAEVIFNKYSGWTTKMKVDYFIVQKIHWIKTNYCNVCQWADHEHVHSRNLVCLPIRGEILKVAEFKGVSLTSKWVIFNILIFAYLFAQFCILEMRNMILVIIYETVSNANETFNKISLLGLKGQGKVKATPSVFPFNTQLIDFSCALLMYLRTLCFPKEWFYVK